LGQQALVEANLKSAREASVSVDATEALRKEGMATIGDVYQAHAALAQAQLNLEQSRGNSQIALGQLATLMGLPATHKLKLLGLSSITPITKTNQNITFLLEAAKRRRPDLLAAEAQVRASQSQLATTKAAIWPTLQVNANVGPTVIDNVNVNNTSVALSISVPLFTGFSQTYDVRRAKAQVLQTAALRDQMYQDVQFQVWQAYYALKTAETSISTADILTKSSTQANQQALGQYKAGVGNILSVLTTQSSLAGARVQSIQARLNWYIALAQLSAAVGILDQQSPV
jgi:outer membrane protein